MLFVCVAEKLLKLINLRKSGIRYCHVDVPYLNPIATVHWLSAGNSVCPGSWIPIPTYIMDG